MRSNARARLYTLVRSPQATSISIVNVARRTAIKNELRRGMVDENHVSYP